MTTQKVTTYLNSLGNTPEYQEIFSQVTQLMKMQQTFSKIVPPNLAEAATLGRISNGKLVIFVKNAAIASKLKQISPTIAAKFKKLGWEVTAIQITVQAHYHSENGSISTNQYFSKKRAHLSQAGVDNLKQFATTLPASELKQSIERLISKKK